MARHCTICDHPRREEIDTALIENIGYRAVAKRFGVSESATFRHRNAHLPLVMLKAHEAEAIIRADNLLGQVQTLQERAMRILTEAEDSGDLRIALQALREARGNIELIAKLMGQLNESVTVNVASEWPLLRSVILNALDPFPEVKNHLATVLSEVDGC